MLSVRHLPVCVDYRMALLRSLAAYADKLVERPHYLKEEGWDDLESLQQVTLGNRMEEHLRAWNSGDA